MFFKNPFSIVTRKIRDNKHLLNKPKICPKTGKCIGSKRKYWWLIWLLPIVGLLSLIWFLIRVLPKPSRATYPCQRFAAPLAGGFVVWIAGLVGSTLAYRKARQTFRQSRYVIAALCLAVSVMAIWWCINITGEPSLEAAFTPAEGPNRPMGVAKGIHPGRVVWTHEPASTSWDGSTGHWWEDAHTDQNVVDYMVSKTLQKLTGQTTDLNAWEALFRHFNQTTGRGDVGFQRGDTVVVKINMNQDNGSTWTRGQGHPSPHAIYSLLKQLINIAGIPGSAITIYDASRYIGDPIFDKIRSNPAPDFQNIRFVVSSARARNGRDAAVYDTNNPLHTKAGIAYLPRCVTEADYLINMALLRPHSLFGVTLCAKNHFGSTYFPSRSSWTPEPLHNHGGRGKNMDTYQCLVNLNGHRHLNGKTLLYLIDGLYGARNQSNNVLKYVSFGDDWTSSIFASQDPLAIDSVALDFIRYEDGMNSAITDVVGNPDNYMHEAALADNPPSGVVYDPEGDGTRLASLGVHEHWNNPVDKQYSRNLGTGEGIELVSPSFNVTTGQKYEYIRHAISDADPGDHIVVSEGIYFENISFNGKNLTLSSTDPGDRSVVANTIIDGDNHAVTFAGGEDASCVLTGFTIIDANAAVYCSDASPAIVDCVITGNTGAGIEIQNGGNPTIMNCEIIRNNGPGIQMRKHAAGRKVTYNYATVTNCLIAENNQYGIEDGIITIANCTIAANGLCGISSHEPTITNSIIYYNDSDGVQIDSHIDATVTYSDVQGGWPGGGNIDADPFFVEIGFWNLNETPDDMNDDFWVTGDYHLLAGSPCIDAGDPSSECALESEPNGGRVNMGAYGGTPQASLSQ
jgi:parallel beta-helix repeat protein